MVINNQVLLQWGRNYCPSTNAVIKFPISYSKITQVVASPYSTDSAMENIENVTITSFNLDYPGSKTGNFSWISIGI